MPLWAWYWRRSWLFVLEWSSRMCIILALFTSLHARCYDDGRWLSASSSPTCRLGRGPVIKRLTSSHCLHDTGTFDVISSLPRSHHSRLSTGNVTNGVDKTVSVVMALVNGAVSYWHWQHYGAVVAHRTSGTYCIVRRVASRAVTWCTNVASTANYYSAVFIFRKIVACWALFSQCSSIPYTISNWINRNVHRTVTARHSQG